MPHISFFVLRHWRPNGCGLWLPEDKKANMWHGRKKCCGLWPPAFPRFLDSLNEGSEIKNALTSKFEMTRSQRWAKSKDRKEKRYSWFNSDSCLTHKRVYKSSPMYREWVARLWKIMIEREIYFRSAEHFFLPHAENLGINTWSEAEFKEFESRLKSAKTRLKLSAGLNLVTFDTILSGTKHIQTAA